MDTTQHREGAPQPGDGRDDLAMLGAWARSVLWEPNATQIEVIPSESVTINGIDLSQIARELGYAATHAVAVFNPLEAHELTDTERDGTTRTWWDQTATMENHAEYVETAAADGDGTTPAAVPAVPSAGSGRLPGENDRPLSARELSEVLAAIEHTKAALGALEMKTATALDDAVRAEDEAARLRARDRGRRVAGELSFAQRVSPKTASRRLRAAHRLVSDMPHMYHALAAGTITTETAYVIGRKTGALDPGRRRTADRALAERLPELTAASHTAWGRELDALIQQIDPDGASDRHHRATQERSVHLTPGPNGMGHLHAHLPALDTAAIAKKLSLAAEGLIVEGDERTHPQIMADLLTDTLLGRDETMDPITLDIGVVITERTLLAPAHDDPAMVEGYGVIPPEAVRAALIDRHASRAATDGLPGAPGDLEATSKTLLRRMFTHPTSGELLAVESRARHFPPGLARLIRLRDITCAAPYCNNAIRQLDHITPHSDGGPTSADNGQGLCALCNSVKELLGTVTRTTGPTGPHTTSWETRLGRTATTSPGPIVGHPLPPRQPEPDPVEHSPDPPRPRLLLHAHADDDIPDAIHDQLCEELAHTQDHLIDPHTLAGEPCPDEPAA